MDELNALFNGKYLSPDDLIAKTDTSFIDSMSNSLQGVISQVQQANGVTAKWRDVMSSLEHPVTGLTNALSVGGTVVGNFVSAIGNIAVATLAAAAIQLLIQGVIYLFTW